MTVNLLATVTLPPTSGIAADNVVNTFAIKTSLGALPTAAEQTAIADALANFYNGWQAGPGHALCDYINTTRSRAANAMAIRLYDISGKELRQRVANSKGVMVWRTPNVGSPVSTFARTLGAQGAGTVVPAEVAIVMSLRTGLRDSVRTEVPDADADGKVDRPKSRNTGRLYIGPLTTNAFAADSGGERRVEPVLRTTLSLAAQGLRTALKNAGPAPDGFTWSIWSRADGALHGVDSVVIDDAFDTMRKRGTKPTGSTNLALV